MRWCRLLLAVVLLSALVVADVPRPPAALAQESFRVLVFSKTAGFRHDSIPAGVAAIQRLGEQHGFAVDATEDAAAFTDSGLEQYATVIFLSTTGDVLNDEQQAAFERYIGAGGGFAGVHAAADTEYEWAFYGELVGAYFESHPQSQDAIVEVADRVHPSTAHLTARVERFDEWYNFQANPRGDIHVLATVDEESYFPGEGAMGFDHPIAWCQDFRGGRSWYTGMGHTTESYSEAGFLEHLLGGILTTADVADADCAATREGSFNKVTLDDNTLDPLELDIADDGRVFFIERGGNLKIHLPEENHTVLAGTLAVNLTHEDGMLGLALDPNFATNGQVFLYYSPAGDSELNRLSRFLVRDDVLDVASERVMLEIPTQRQECCHTAGSMQFDRDGNLFLATGDNTNPFQSNTYAPIDERPGRNPFDAQKSSSNTNDLRGKILRIHPEPDGSYTVPAGNLFPAGTPNTRPEIYIMGNRNPYRIGIDSETGWLYWGEVGPDAFVDNPIQGPRGYDEFNQARAAGNYGWPYCIGNNFAYLPYSFLTNTPEGPPYDCAGGPTNDSPNNSGQPNGNYPTNEGLDRIPPAQPAMVYYPYTDSGEFPEMNGGDFGRTAMASSTYHRPEGAVGRSLPAYYSDSVFLFEWSRNFIREVKLDDEGNLLQLNPFLSEFDFRRPMDMEYGPDGTLYLIEWGSEFFGGNSDSGLYRIDYTGDPNAIGPTVVGGAAPTSGQAPLAVTFSSAGSTPAREGEVLSFAWDFQRDGTVDSTEPNPTFTFERAGTYDVSLVVTDPLGNLGSANVPITVGNTAPEVSIQTPLNGSFFAFGDTIPFRLQVDDVEQGSTGGGRQIDCAQVVLQPGLGHDTHTHPEGILNRCEGTFTSAADSGHGDLANTFYAVDANYTDDGSGVAPLRGRRVHVLQPKLKQAEFMTTSQGVEVTRTNELANTPGVGNGVGSKVVAISDGDFTSYDPVNFHAVDELSFILNPSVESTGGTIEVRLDAADGPLLTTALVPPLAPPTSPFNPTTFEIIAPAFSDPGGTHHLYLVFRGAPESQSLFELDAFRVEGEGATRDSGAAPPTPREPRPPAASPPPPPPPPAPGPPSGPGELRIDRIAGQDRFETAALVSAAAFPDGADVAYVATGGNFPDALAGGAAAAAEDGPVLLVGSDVPAVTADELDRLAPDRVVILGGVEAVSGQVAAALEADGRVVERRAGFDRFETAAQVAAASFESAPVVYVASGATFPDALSGGAAAARVDAPVLLVAPDRVPAVTAEQLERLSAGRIVLLGGTEAVSADVERALEAFAPVTRLAGRDRFETAAAVAAAAFPEADAAFLATGGDYPDALSAVPAAARAQAPVLLVAGDVPAGTQRELERLRPSIVTILGGTAAVPAAVEEAVRGLLGG